MAPLPRARPKPVDLAFARPRPPETIAFAVAAVDFGYRFAATGELRSWSGFIAAPTKEAALLEAIARIRADHGKHLRMRFLVNLPGTSPLWRQSHQAHGGSNGRTRRSSHWWMPRSNSCGKLHRYRSSRCRWNWTR